MRARSRLVLVVDDEPHNAKLLDRILATEGHRTCVCADGASALAAVAAEPPDLILLDVMMPGLDGHEVCRRLKASADTRLIPIVLVTALSEVGDKVRGLDAGADDFLSKPINRAELLARVRTHLRMKALLDELEESRGSLYRQNVRLRQLEQLRWDLVHMVVHDLKSPLAALQLNSELLHGIAEVTPPDVVARVLARIGDCSTSLNRMVENILDVARLEEARMTLKPVASAPRELVASGMRHLETVAAAASTGLRIEAADDLPAAYGDRELLARVVANLVGNALKVSSGAMPVEVTVVGHPDGGLLFTVSDRGPGVPDEIRDAIFDKFRSAEVKRLGVFRNHGLGLTFCKMAVEAHGGAIWVESRPGGGSHFRFTLPAQPVAAELVAPPALV